MVIVMMMMMMIIMMDIECLLAKYLALYCMVYRFDSI